MNIYRSEKYGERMALIKKMPQVVSLISSLGTLKTSVEEIKEAVLDISANMDAESVSRITKNSDELKDSIVNSKNNCPSDSRNHVEAEQEKIEELVNLMDVIQEFSKMTEQEISSTIQRRIHKINLKRIEQPKKKQ